MHARWLALQTSVFFALLLLCSLLLTDVIAQDVCTLDHSHDETEEDQPELRETAVQPVTWRAATTAVAAVSRDARIPVQILAINDFHGQLSAGRLVAGRPVGGAAVLASYLNAAQAGIEKNTLIVHAGDQVGASPPESALLQDEPTIAFLNFLANRQCSTGTQIVTLLEQQWLGQPFPRMLQISGLTYTWDNSHPIGSRIVEVRTDGVVIDTATVYTVAVNSFLAAGGDKFTVLTQGANPVGGPIDLDALITYIESLTQPFTAVIEGRITRLN